MNDVTKSIVDAQRGGKNPEWVFPYQGRAIAKMNDSAPEEGEGSRGNEVARRDERSSAQGIRASTRFKALCRTRHKRHRFGRRLRAAGVSFEDRQVLLGYQNGSVTTHYSAPDIGNLIDAANRVATTEQRKIDAMTILRRKTG